MSEDDDDLWLFTSYSDEADIEAVTDVLQRGAWWAKGPEIEEFEGKIADIAGCEYGIALNSGTSALFAMLVANGITDGEVIVPSHTFSATANAVVAAGAEPIFADIERDSLALDPNDVRERITDETRAIMPIHFAGDICAGIRDLRNLADENDLLLFEDACHSIGAKLDGEPVGSFGDAAAFSFCFNKILTTGEGGMVVTDSRQLKEDLELFRSHGQNDRGVYVTYGHNFRMSSMTAALGVSQTEKLDFIVSRRKEMAEYLTKRLSVVDAVKCPVFPLERETVYQLYNLLVNDPSDREGLRKYLDQRGVPTRVTYNPVHLSEYYRSEWGPGNLPVTEDVSTKILTLPFHLELSKDDLDRIATAVHSYFD